MNAFSFLKTILLGTVALGTLTAAETTSLLEREPEGWTNYLADFSALERVPFTPKRPLTEPSPWKMDAKTGVLECRAEGIHELLLSRKPEADGVIHLEWRYVGEPAKPNAGLFLRTSDDASTWVQAHLSTAGLGALVGVKAGDPKKFSAGKKQPDLQRPAGEWNVVEVTCRGPELTLWINGTVTAEMKDCPVKDGRIGLEAEFHTVEFRNFLFKPLPAP